MSLMGKGQTDIPPEVKEWMEESGRLSWHHPASQTAVDLVIDQDPNDDDGRSEWLWIRLANGDLILGCYPQGETYFAVEIDAADH